MTRPYRNKISLSVAAASLVMAATAFSPALAGKAPSVRGTKQGDFSRIMFHWPGDVNISARVDGTRLAMTFNQKADFDFNALMRSLSGTVLDATLTPDGRTVMLSLDRPYRIRTFTGDKLAGVDLLEPIKDMEERQGKTRKERAKPAAENKKTTKVKPEAKTAAAQAQAKSQTTPAVKTGAPNTTPSPRSLATLSPAAGTDTPASARPHPQSAPAENPAQPAPAGEIAVQHNNPAALTELSPAAPAQTGADSADNILSIMPSVGREGIVLRFGLTERTASAVFTRAGNIWIVFNRPVNVNLELLDNQLPNQTGKAEQLNNEGATIIRIPFEGVAGTAVTKDTGSFAWQVMLSPAPQPTTIIPAIKINTDPSVKPHILVEAMETSPPLHIIDPTVGDELVIVPSYKSGEGIMPGREFVDFSLIESTQGFVVQKISDDTSVMPTRSGIRLSTRGGAQLSPGLPQPETPASSGENPASLTFFPYEAWKPGNPVRFDQEVRKTFAEMALAQSPSEKNGLRMRLTHLYLGQGMGVEALGMLQEIRRTDPAFFIARKLNALAGAANFISYRFGDAAQNFAALELNNHEEIMFWRQMIAELLGSDQERFDYLGMSKYISKYPPVMRQRLAILAADRSIAAKEFSKALKILDSVQENPETLDGIKPYVNFLLGKISAETGQDQAAIEVWRELAENYDSPYVRASAEFSLVTEQLRLGLIDSEETIKRLERLRIAWRGDGLELSVLSVLGNLYDDKGDYANALNAWRDIVTVFPNTGQANEVNKRMQAAFVTLFKQAEPDKMSGLDALALFYEYRDLTPLGQEGDGVVHMLADKLIDIDLLEQAALLLDQQMRTRQQKDGRSRTGAKLALVYLLNREPEKALQALELSAYGDNPDDLRITRDRMAAQALTATGRFDEALALLAGDTGVEAEQLRIQVYWKRKDWSPLITSAETLLKKRDDPTAPISVNESDTLLKLALSYAFEKDWVQLQYLRDYFGPLLAQNPNKEVFDFLTQPNLVPDPENFEAAMQQVDATRNFLESFRTHLKNSAQTTPPSS